MKRNCRGMWGADWARVEFDPSGISFNLTTSYWFRLFNQIEFAAQNFQELHAPEEACHVRSGILAERAKNLAG